MEELKLFPYDIHKYKNLQTPRVYYFYFINFCTNALLISTIKQERGNYSDQFCLLLLQPKVKIWAIMYLAVCVCSSFCSVNKISYDTVMVGLNDAAELESSNQIQTLFKQNMTSRNYH